MTKKLTDEEKKERKENRRIKKEKIFLEKANDKFNDKFNYEEFEYINETTKGIIICPKHGEFKQEPRLHLTSKYGCLKCSCLLNNEEKEERRLKFINDANKKHKNKFNYEEFEYQNVDTSGIIICPKHGKFEQSPYLHMKSRYGCKECAGLKKITKNIFIKKAKKIHGDRYDYSQVICKDSKNKVIIICSIHGDFKQSPSKHLSGQGCPKCVGKNKNFYDFINEANKIHNSKYKYIPFTYKNNKQKIKIICSKHNEFIQTISDHLTGYGCNKCGIESMIKKQSLCKENFILRSIKIHKNKYNYSEFEYINAKTKGIIICPIHGKFIQEAFSHMSGCGCPKCSKIGTSKIAQEWINLLLIKQPELEHFYHENGEYTIPNTNYKADGYNKKIKTIYEFHGDFWHGNPEVFNHKLMNDVCKKTFGELYEKTMKKQRKCEELGYKYKSIWENEWIKGKLALKRIQNNFRHKQMLKKFPYQCDKCNFKCKYKSEYDRHCNSELHKTGKRGVKKNKVNRICQICKLYEASCNTNMKNHILINHKTAEEREKEYPNYCKTCDYGSFSKKLFDKHLTTKKHKKKEEMVKKLKDVD